MEPMEFPEIRNGKMVGATSGVPVKKWICFRPEAERLPDRR